jgi:hypothetical protein
MTKAPRRELDFLENAGFVLLALQFAGSPHVRGDDGGRGGSTRVASKRDGRADVRAAGEELGKAPSGSRVGGLWRCRLQGLLRRRDSITP